MKYLKFVLSIIVITIPGGILLSTVAVGKNSGYVIGMFIGILLALNPFSITKD